MIYVSTFKKTLKQALKAGGVDKGTAADLTETLETLPITANNVPDGQ